MHVSSRYCIYGIYRVYLRYPLAKDVELYEAQRTEEAGQQKGRTQSQVSFPFFLLQRLFEEYKT